MLKNIIKSFNKYINYAKTNSNNKSKKLQKCKIGWT